MRALVVAPQPFFSPRGTPFSVYYRTLVTAELGVEVDLLTYGQGQEVAIDGVKIHRIPAFRFLGQVPVGPSWLKLFLDVFLVVWTLGLLVRRRYDFVHAHEEAIFFLRFLQPIFGFKLIYDMHSSLPLQLTAFRFTRSRLFISLFERLEDACLRHAHGVITISPALADYARPRMPDPERHVLIENSLFESVRLVGAPQDEQPAEIALPEGRKVVGYAGTFESYQGIDLLLRAFVHVRREAPQAFLLLLGGNEPQVEQYRRLAEQLGVAQDCRFVGSVVPDLARSTMRRVDVVTSPRVEGNNTPLKIYEQLASGVPLVATEVLSHTQVLSEEECFLAPVQDESFARAILRALTDGAEAQRRVERARRLYEKDYARPAYVAKLSRLLSRVTGGPPCAA